MNKKARAIFEYSLLIFLVVCGLLTVKFSLKRSFQGRIVYELERFGNEYNYGSIYLYEVSRGSEKRKELALPFPKNKVKTKGDYQWSSERNLYHKDRVIE